MAYPPSSLIATGIVFALLCVISTALRFWVRTSYNQAVGTDDGFIVIAALIVTSFDALQVENIIHGQATSIHRSDASAVLSSKIDYYQVITEKIAYGCIKLSFLTFYRRIFGPWSTFRKVNNLLIGLVAAWAIAYLMAAIFVCGVHPAAQWEDSSNRAERCYDNGAVLFSFALTNVFTDLAVLSLPFAYIHRLHMSRSKKWAVTGVFLLGFLSTFAGIIRLAFISVYFKLHQLDWIPPPLDRPPKILNVIGPIGPVFWVNLELACGVVAANLPPLWPLIRNPQGFGLLCVRARRKLSDSSLKFRELIELRAGRKSTQASTTTNQSLLAK